MTHNSPEDPSNQFDPSKDVAAFASDDLLRQLHGKTAAYLGTHGRLFVDEEDVVPVDWHEPHEPLRQMIGSVDAGILQQVVPGAVDELELQGKLDLAHSLPAPGHFLGEAPLVLVSLTQYGIGKGADSFVSIDTLFIEMSGNRVASHRLTEFWDEPLIPPLHEQTDEWHQAIEKSGELEEMLGHDRILHYEARALDQIISALNSNPDLGR